MSVKFEYCDDMLKYAHSHSILADESNYRLHTHSDYEIYIFLSGRGRYMVEGTAYSLRPGYVFVFKSGEAHMPQIDTDEPYERIAINFTGDFLNGIDPKRKLLVPFLDRPLGRMNCYKNISFVKKAEDLIKVNFQSEYEKRIYVYNFVMNILFEVYLNFGELRENTGNEYKNQLITRIVEYVNENLFSNISLDEISSHFFISKSQINRSFKKFTGSTAWEYITAKRLINARKLIISGESAKNSCTSSGFEDYSSFFRAYKKRFGVSPSDDRKK